MKIIAECGATKSDWTLIYDGVGIRQVLTPGINVSAMAMDAVRAVVNNALKQFAGLEDVTAVHLYVAGVVTEEIEAELEATLSAYCPSASLEVETDLVAAARAPQ